jgi:hypothetical protein
MCNSFGLWKRVCFDVPSLDRTASSQSAHCDSLLFRTFVTPSTSEPRKPSRHPGVFRPLDSVFRSQPAAGSLVSIRGTCFTDLTTQNKTTLMRTLPGDGWSCRCTRHYEYWVKRMVLSRLHARLLVLRVPSAYAGAAEGAA